MENSDTTPKLTATNSGRKKQMLSATKRLVLIGMLSASITSGKLALAVIPNVEIVTLLIMAYTIVFGLKISLPTTLIFVTTEMLIYGVNTWIISYYIHWCLIAVVTAAVYAIFKDKHYIPYVITATLLTAMFGVLTSFFDTIFYANSSWSYFWSSFTIMYLRGVSFYVTHIVSNTIVVALGLFPLVSVMKKLVKSYFN
ncbi:MAG: hypothetical protein R3Y23_05375 [Bacillota bacterium]